MDKWKNGYKRRQLDRQKDRHKGGACTYTYINIIRVHYTRGIDISVKALINCVWLYSYRKYECQLNGTFVLYRNAPFEQEVWTTLFQIKCGWKLLNCNIRCNSLCFNYQKVQEKHHICSPGYSYPRCSCAVAVRSGRDIFVVDICNSRTVINFPSCEDKILNVIKKNDRYYKVGHFW